MKTPPREFTFARETFNLYIETTEDGERLAREQAEQARREEMRHRAIAEHPTLALREEPCAGFPPLTNGGDFVGTFCTSCGKTEPEHAAQEAKTKN